jgi:hypothetical protein
MKKILMLLLVTSSLFGSHLIDYNGVLRDTRFDDKNYKKVFFSTGITMSGGTDKKDHACVATASEYDEDLTRGMFFLIGFTCDTSKLKTQGQKEAYKEWKEVIDQGYPIVIRNKEIIYETPKNLGIWYFDIEKF